MIIVPVNICYSYTFTSGFHRLTHSFAVPFDEVIKEGMVGSAYYVFSVMKMYRPSPSAPSYQSLNVWQMPSLG